ncbi:MAG: hypothetical protein FJ271_30495 [Planctomycetes bacterium]|nr:hypothetical protein [Planctomycetota bacterium]
MFAHAKNGAICFTVVALALIGSQVRVAWCRADDSNGSGPGDLFSISSGPVDDPDIVASRCIPVVGRELTLSARVRGPGAHPVEVRFLLKAKGEENVVLSAKAGSQAKSDKKGTYVVYQATWKPTRTGIYALTVQVDPASKSGDKITKNNTATTTLPVTWRELHILAWGPQRQMKWITAAPSPDVPTGGEVQYWHRRGILMLGYMTVREEHFLNAKEADVVDFTAKLAGRHASIGCDGLIIDETGAYPNAEGLEFIRRFGVAYDKVREKHPGLRVYNWIAGPLNREELEGARRNKHILMGESYEAIHGRNAPTFPRFLTERVAKLATVNPWEESGPGGIIALGIGGDCGVTFRPQIENSVRLCRRLGPDLPGICYYGVPSLEPGKPNERSLQQFLDDLTFRYFIKPVLSVGENDIWLENLTPAPSEKVRVHVRVHNVGGVAAGNVEARIYARAMSTNDRDLIGKSVIPQIGNGTRVLKEEQPTVNPYRFMGDTKHPAAVYGKEVRLFLNQALIEAAWTPKQASYYRLEVELTPSPDHTILEGFASKVIPVSTVDEP